MNHNYENYKPRFHICLYRDNREPICSAPRIFVEIDEDTVLIIENKREKPLNKADIALKIRSKIVRIGHVFLEDMEVVNSNTIKCLWGS